MLVSIEQTRKDMRPYRDERDKCRAYAATLNLRRYPACLCVQPVSICLGGSTVRGHGILGQLWVHLDSVFTTYESVQHFEQRAVASKSAFLLSARLEQQVRRSPGTAWL